MENYPDSFTFQSFPALNLEMLWFHKRTIHVGFSSRRNSTASGGAKWDLLNAQCPYKTGSSQPAELKPGYWYWLRISSASSTLQSWLASEFFQCYFWAMCCYSSSTPEEPSMSVMLAIWLLFKTSQFSWGCLFLDRTDGPRLQCSTVLPTGETSQ